MAEDVARVSREHLGADGVRDAMPDATVDRFLSFLNPTDTVLELGGGDGQVAVAIAPAVKRYVCSDSAGDLVAVAQARTRALDNVECVNLSAEDASLPRHLDAVIAIDLFQVLDDVPRALQRIHGLLRPGGLLLSRTVTVSGSSQALRLPDIVRQAMGLKPRMSIVPPVVLERMVRTAGFEVISCDMVPRGSHNCMIVARAH